MFAVVLLLEDISDIALWLQAKTEATVSANTANATDKTEEAGQDAADLKRDMELGHCLFCSLSWIRLFEQNKKEKTCGAARIWELLF